MFIVAGLSLAALLLPTNTHGQGMPPRGNTLMRTQPLTKACATPTQVLRRAIINSTNPITGTIHVKQFRVQSSTLNDVPINDTAVVTQYSTQSSTLDGVKPGKPFTPKPTGIQGSTID
jgi:hypothetical protein